MSRIAFALVPMTLLGAACTDFDGHGANPEAPTTPITAQPMLSVGAAPAIVATSGTQGVTVPQTLIGYSGAASDGFSVEPDSKAWPNAAAPTYWIRAHAAGAGSFEISTDRGNALGSIEAADLARVAIVPANYELDGSSAFTLASDRLDVQAALFDAGDRRLVDATLLVSGATQTAWDRATLAAGLGAHEVLVGGDSIATAQTATITVVQGADRVETVRVGDRACIHAYAGDVEVATNQAPVGGTVDPLATNCATF